MKLVQKYKLQIKQQMGINQVQKYNSQSQTQQPDYPFRITIITLSAYIIGVVAFFNLYIATPPLAILIILITANHQFQLFTQPRLQLLSFMATTFIFGLIHAHTYSTLTSSHSPSEQSQWPLLQIYLAFMAVYYYFEFQLNNCFHHHELNWKSFLIYHSTPYFIAQTFCLCQHFITKHLLNFQYKNSHLLIYPALLFMVLGQGLRIAAFFTAKSNFTHLVRYKKHPTHQLITHGVYSFFRHPSYTGYFYFAVASQLFLGNWISAVGFFVVLVKFFNDRIHDEEYMLAKFFQKYLYYKKTTHILIPFVKSPDSQEIMKYLIKNVRSSSVYEDSDD